MGGFDVSHMIFLIPALPLAGFLLSGMGGRQLGKGGVSAVSCGLPVLSFLISVAALLQVLRTGAPIEQDLGRWIGACLPGTNFSFRVDSLAAAMLMVVAGVGSLIHFYSVGYMAADKGYARYFAFLNLFLGSMLILVMAGNLLFLFVGWELVGLCSYLLIGFWYEDAANSKAGMKAFVFNRIGDLGFLVGIFLAYWAFGTFDFAQMRELAFHGGLTDPVTGAFRAAPVDMSVLPMIGLCLFVGATGKSAQIPLFVWLPDAMAGPTPVSALIHAATMVTAGIYMMARMEFVYARTPEILAIVAVVGGLTALVGAIIAMTQNDIKKVLAYSTVSQLGYMVLGCGAAAFSASVFHIVTHSFFKAALFLSAGVVIHALAGAQDMRKMGGLRRALPWTCALAFVGALALAGIPPFSGFVSKDGILLAVLVKGTSEGPFARLYIALYAAAAIGEYLTAFYIFRWLALTFFGDRRFTDDGSVHEAPAVMLLPLGALALLAVLGGALGLPHGGAIREFLSASVTMGSGRVEAPASLAYFNIAVSAAFASLGAIVAWVVYARRRLVPSGKPGGVLHRISFNKFYLDEICSFAGLIVEWGSRALLLVVDQVLIDGLLVHGLGGRAVRRLGRLLRQTQTGEVNAYAAVFVFGAVLILIYLALVPGVGG